MKKTILILLVSAMTSVFVNAQTTWDFNSGSWANNATGYNNAVVDNLAMTAGSGTTNFAIVEANTKTFSDGTVLSKRLKFGGASWDTTATAPYLMPTKRYLSFNVPGNCVIKVYFLSSSTGASTTLNVTDGANVIGSASGDGTTGNILTAGYTGAATTIYIGAIPTQAANIYKISVSATVSTLSTNNVNVNKSAKIYSSEKQVYLSGIKSNSEVKVYNINGEIIKSFNTKVNTNFELKTTGLYIVTVKNNEGEETQKVLVK